MTRAALGRWWMPALALLLLGCSGEDSGPAGAEDVGDAPTDSRLRSDVSDAAGDLQPDLGERTDTVDAVEPDGQVRWPDLDAAADGDAEGTGLKAPPGFFGYPEYGFDSKGMEPALADLLQAWLDGGQAGAVLWAKDHDTQLWNGNLQLMLRDTMRDGERQVPTDKVFSAGAQVIDSYQDISWISLSFEGLLSLTQDEAITGFENLWLPAAPVVEPLPDPPDFTPMEDWAIDAIGLAPCLQNSSTGLGVTIAVLDAGFQFAPQLIEAGLLPEGTKIHKPKEGFPDDWEDSPHGTAVAQIVHRAAPGAKLELLIVPNSEVMLGKAVDWCIANGVDVINASWGRYNQSFYDGQGPICEKTKKAWDNGIVWVSASGNSANGKHWHGGWKDDNDNGIHEFENGQEFLSFSLDEGEKVTFYFTWDSWPAVILGGYVMCLEYWGYPLDDPGQIVTEVKCTKALNFNAEPETLASIMLDNEGCQTEPDKYLCLGGDFKLSIRVPEGILGQMLKPPKGQKLVLFASPKADGFALSQSMAEESMVDPAVVEEVLTVGAVHWESWDEGTVAAYSSYGPTNAGVQKPEIVGPSGVYTAFSTKVTGTSFSAPYAAAAAAIVLQKHPEMTPNEVKQELIDQAVSAADVIPDQKTGYGKLHLDCCALNCEGKECGGDGCGGVCGTCAADEYCFKDFSCEAAGTDECPFGCDDGDPCTDDVCLVSGNCIYVPMPDGAKCQPDGDWKCEGGLCSCTSTCGVKECGPDNCGGTCGDCNDGVVCTQDLCKLDDGTCTHLADDESCNDGDSCTMDHCDAKAGGCVHVDFGLFCDDGVACTTDFCLPASGCMASTNDAACEDGIACTVEHCDAEKGCVAVPMNGLCDDGVACTQDACDVEAGCIHAPDDEPCDDSSPCTVDSCATDKGCVHSPVTNGVSCGVGQACVDGKCECIPACAGKECGPDGCGGLCGMCLVGQACVDGKCECIPACAGKECGPDGCGGSCGACSGGKACDAQGLCQGGCVPSCTFQQCGPDGCGGTCGTCPVGLACQEEFGMCACPPNCVTLECKMACSCAMNCIGKECGSNGCKGVCGACEPWQTCVDGHCCEPNCENNECGSDGCGGVCGVCGLGWDCVDNFCVPTGGTCPQTQDCTGLSCGPDPVCGLSCGTCPEGSLCDPAGQCLCDKWLKKYDISGKNTGLADAVALPSGGLVLAGGISPEAGGDGMIWLVGTDPFGGILWEQQYGGISTDAVGRLLPVSTGGFLMCGTTYSKGAGKSDLWMLRLDSNGGLLWDKVFGGTSYEGCNDVLEEADGGFLAVGYTQSKGAGSSDMWLVRVDKNGTPLWDKTYGGASQDAGETILSVPGGGYMVAGWNRSKTMTFDGWLVRLDASAGMVWEKTYGDASKDQRFYGLDVASDGGYILAGNLAQGVASYDEGWVVKVDASGSLQWQQTLAGNYFETFYTVKTVAGGYLAGGRKCPSNSPGDWDAWLQKVDLSGNPVWSKTWGGGGANEMRFIHPAGKYLLAGGTYVDSTESYQAKALLLSVDSNGSTGCTCGDGLCQSAAGETCDTCAADCPCP